MKTTRKYLLLGLLAAFAAASCSDDDEGITPSEVSNLRAESTPGRIVLRWDTPQDGTIQYVQVNYYDPLEEIEAKRLASIYADSIDIPNTRQKYGTYSFRVKSVSPSGAMSAEQEISAVSEPAEKSWTFDAQVALTADMLSTNAQEAWEGPISALVDGILGVDDKYNFFHTSWSSYVAPPHTMTVALSEPIDEGWQFFYAPRGNNNNNRPIDFDMFGSMNGTEWFLIKNFTKDADGLPTDAGVNYTSEVLDARDHPFLYLKMSVNKTNNGENYWSMSEFRLFTYTVIDPEADDD